MLRRGVGWCWAACAGAGVVVAPAAWGQPLIPSAGFPPLKRVEPGIGDIGGLSVSNRVMQADLRVPTGFEGVYSFQQRDRFGQLETYYVRSDGALTAVFPRSSYVDTATGVQPAIPAGTVWVLGPLKIQEPAKTPVHRSYNALDYSIHGGAMYAGNPAAGGWRAPVPEALSIWDDEAYRRRRIGRLLDAAGR